MLQDKLFCLPGCNAARCEAVRTLSQYPFFLIAGLDPAIQKSVVLVLDGRVTPRSLSSGRASRGPVGGGPAMREFFFTFV
jgi:hypothetical protein